MPVPKRRHSKTRGRKRRTNWKLSQPAIALCPKCHNPMIPHHVCPTCGYYNKREVIVTVKKM